MWCLDLNADYYSIRLAAEAECVRHSKFQAAKVEVVGLFSHDEITGPAWYVAGPVTPKVKSHRVLIGYIQARPLGVNQNQLCHLLKLFYMNNSQGLISSFLSPYHMHMIVICV